MQNKGACGGACQASDKCLNWTRIIFGVLAIGSMVTAVIFFAVPEAGDFPTKQIVQATSTVATCVFGTVGLFTHGALMENKFKESSGLGKTNFILGILGFLIVIAAPILFMCGIGPVVGSIIGGTGALFVLIPLIAGLFDTSDPGTPTTDPFNDQEWSQNLLLGKETIVKGTTELTALAPDDTVQLDSGNNADGQFDDADGQFDDAEEDLEQAAGTKIAAKEECKTCGGEGTLDHINPCPDCAQRRRLSATMRRLMKEINAANVM